jgi:hypothetical protein
MYPNEKTSQRLSLKALWIGFLNNTFPLVTGLVGWFIFAANTAGLRTRNPGHLEDVYKRWSVPDLLTGDFRSSQTAVTFALLFAAMFAFAIPRETGHSMRRVVARVSMAVVHTVLHLIAAALESWVVLRAADRLFGGGTAFQIGAAVLMVLSSAVVGSLMVGIYLAGFGWFGRHDNESFSAFRHEGYKNFLRMRVGVNGVEVYALGIERAVRKWNVNGESNRDPSNSWIGPSAGMAPKIHVIDRFLLP